MAFTGLTRYILQSHGKRCQCHRRKCYGGLEGKSYVTGALGRVLWKGGIWAQLKDGVVTGGEGRENILVFPQGMSGWAWLDPTCLQWLGAGTRICLLSYESRWSGFIRNNLLLYSLESILPEWVRLICWTRTWPALLPPVFFLFLGEIGDMGSRAVSLAPLKSQAQKKSEQKIKIALHISGTEKVPECSPFTFTKFTNYVF